MKYIDVIIPLPIEGVFTYYVSTGVDIKIGQRVIVQFGSRKFYTAIVFSVHENKPIHYNAKPILEILDEDAIVNSKQLEFWQWISSYYMCSLGSVMQIALPSGFKLASESKISIHPDFNGDTTDLNNQESKLVSVLINNEEISMQEATKMTGFKNIFNLVYTLSNQEILISQEELHEKYHKKIIRTVVFTKDEEDIDLLKFKKAPKQYLFILDFLKLVKKYPKRKFTIPNLIKQLKTSRSCINALVAKRVLKIQEENISRLNKEIFKIKKPSILSQNQKDALYKIKESFCSRNVCLLHGVTSSGKTELYIHLIQEQIDKNKQVLYLLPEIALTTQIINRLKRHFGNKIGVFHSGMNNAERVEVWNATKEQNDSGIRYSVLLGVRSSIFLPFDNLGLIIVDEEHEPSYKQHHPAPRYNARDSAIYLSRIHRSKVLLGSATPSLESYLNTQSKFAIVEMNERFKELPLPKIHCVDIRKAYLKKEMTSYFSFFLIDQIKETLALGRQIILFQNRRGYAPVLNCSDCGFTPSCKSCDVSLTIHKSNNELKCHYCGYSVETPSACNSCNSNSLNSKGFGTEKIEEDLQGIFQDAVIQRMDYDTTRKKHAYQKIITDFEQGRIDILVGTQMIAKGLDFDQVTLVGILHADNLLSYPDFRSHERAFQLMMQVAGRSGRKNKEGRVVLQTYNPENEVIQFLLKYDYNSFVKTQLKERKLFRYPPYNRLISLTLKHKNSNKLDRQADDLGKMLRISFEKRVLGPEYPIISRIRNYYHKRILLKIESKSSIIKAKEIIRSILDKIKSQKKFSGLRVIVDIDPI